MEQIEILFKKLHELRNEETPNEAKINAVIDELKARGHNITPEDSEKDNHYPKDRLNQFEDEGAPDDDFMD